MGAFLRSIRFKRTLDTLPQDRIVPFAFPWWERRKVFLCRKSGWPCCRVRRGQPRCGGRRINLRSCVGGWRVAFMDDRGHGAAFFLCFVTAWWSLYLYVACNLCEQDVCSFYFYCNMACGIVLYNCFCIYMRAQNAANHIFRWKSMRDLFVYNKIFICVVMMNW